MWWKGIIRDESWAAPLLIMSVITLCALLLLTVVKFCSWFKPTIRRKQTLIPWLQMPLLVGLMILAGTSIVAAVPPNEDTCRLLFLAPGLGYVLLCAGLLSKIIQYLMHAQMMLQWMLVFFVILNQFVISIAYMVKMNKCQLTIHDQLFILIYPGLLVGIILLLVYRTSRRTHSKWGTSQAVHIGLAAAFNGAICGFWLGTAAVLSDRLFPSCLGYGCLATAAIVSLIMFIPRQQPQECAVKNSTHQEATPVKKDANLPSRREKSNNNNSDDKFEKSAFLEPEIVVVPITPERTIPLPDIALKAIKAHNKQHHQRHSRHRKLEKSDRIVSIKTPNGTRHSSRPHRWNNKIVTDSTKTKRQSIRHRGIDSEIRTQRTPYNHRGWLY